MESGPLIASCIAAIVFVILAGTAFVVVASRPAPQKPQTPPQKPTHSTAKTPPRPDYAAPGTISTNLVGWNVDVAVAYLQKSQPDKDVYKIPSGSGWTKDLRLSRIRVSYDPKTNLVDSQPRIG